MIAFSKSVHHSSNIETGLDLSKLILTLKKYERSYILYILKKQINLSNSFLRFFEYKHRLSCSLWYEFVPSKGYPFKAPRTMYFHPII